MNWRLLLIGLWMPVAACHTMKKTAIVAPRELEGVVISANNNPMDIYRESAARTWDILHTRVALSFNYKEKTAAGRAWLTLVPYCCPQDSLVLDAKGMQIDSVAWMEPNGAFKNIAFTYADDQLIIHRKVNKWLGLSSQAAKSEELYIKYTAMPYADSNGGGSQAITEARGLYFINTDFSIPGKPAQIWTQGETESNSHWMPTIDKPNERFTTQLELTVPDSFKTLSNGAFIASRKETNGLRTDTWKMDLPIQAYATMFAIGNYSIVKEEPWRGKEVSYYVEPEYAPYAKLIFRHTREMMEYFSNITGVPYPWNKYSQVIARDYVSGAMENTSASLFGEFVNQNDREHEDKNYEDIVSHELFHQWFGDYTTMESWSNLTVSESFANYGEQLWRKHYYGSTFADELAYDDLYGYLSSTERADPQLVRHYYQDKEEMFDRVSYNKGGAILRYLHGLIGDSLFYKSMNLYLTQNALQSTEATHWRLAVEAATGRDWNWFFNQWYYRPGHPELDIQYKYDDANSQLTVTVRQDSKPDSGLRYQLPLKTGIINGTALTITDWHLKKRIETFTYPYVNGQRPVIVPDYYSWLPGTIEENKKPAQWLSQFLYANNYINKRRALNGVRRSITDSTANVMFTAALTDSMDAIRVYALNVLATKDLQESFRQQVIYMAVQDRSNKVRTAAFNCLGEWKVNTLKTEMLQAADDRSYAVAGAALQALYTVDETMAYNKAKAMLTTSPRASLERAIWQIIAEEGKEADFAIFEEKENNVYGQRRVSRAQHLASYTRHVQDKAVFDKSLAMLDKLYQVEHIYKQSVFFSVLGSLSSLKETGKGKDNTRADQARALLQKWVNNMTDKNRAQIALDRSF
jgi:aminopeptidase N